MKDIAREAGVSVSTVSKILNHQSSSFSPETVKSVIEASKRLSYEEFVLSTKKTQKTIRLVVPKVENPFYASIVRFIEAAVSERDLSVMLSITGGIPQKEYEVLSLALRERDSAIFCPLNPVDCGLLRECDMEASPIVFFNTRIEDPHVSYVTIDNFHGIETAINYLWSKGRRKIAYLKGKPDEERFESYLQVLKRKNLEINENLVAEGDYTYYGGYSGIVQLLERGTIFDAVVACNDLAAIGAIEALKSRGIKVPERVSVVGFDDIWFSSIYTPKLTTIRQPLSSMCETAVRILLEKLGGRKDSKKNVFQPQLVIRESA